ncbi:hypothetical protein OS493_003491 [Desmophyllum pertusum]|uniref:Uncharacterized protein n=1 Tax=Desmophyllum pertusum TaxID=174260 RepID=A0A9X0DBG5_9CNID|nr:hypothetical protein OS493_003491 [Desmophyllum pertusum]
MECFVVPVLWQVYKKRFCQEQYSCRQLSIFTFALILEIAGVAVLMAIVDKNKEKPVDDRVTFKVAIGAATDEPAPGRDHSLVQQSLQVELGGVSVTLPRGETILDVATSSKSARGKAAVITSLLENLFGFHWLQRYFAMSSK